MTRSPSAPPVRPRRPSLELSQFPDRIEIVNRRREWGVGCSLLLWLTGWTVGCVVLAAMVLAQPHLFTLLFALPFWASWLLVSSLVMKSFFQRETFTLDASGVSFARNVAALRMASRSIPRNEIHAFESYSRVTDSESGSTTQGLAVRTLGEPLQFAEGLSRDEREWVVWELNALLQALGGGAPRDALAEDRAESDAGSAKDSASHALDQETGARLVVRPEVSPDESPPAVRTEQLVAPASRPVQPPSDCQWERVADPDDFDALAFRQRGRFQPGGILGLLFINVFWNGIVSVFVFAGLLGWTPDGAPAQGQPDGFGWWGLFFFLIPFEVIGLVMFGLLCAVILAPLRTTTWQFTGSELTCRVRWLLAGLTWRRPIEQLAQIELSRGGAQAASLSVQNAQPNAPGGRDYVLKLVDRQRVEIAAISGLTEGEARWMADCVLRERGHWFRRR